MFVAKYWLFFPKQTLKKKKIKLQHSLSYIGVGHWKKKINKNKAAAQAKLFYGYLDAN